MRDLRDVQSLKWDFILKRYRPDQCSTERLEQHLNAPANEWQSRLQKMNQWQIERHRHEFRTVYARSRGPLLLR